MHKSSIIHNSKIAIVKFVAHFHVWCFFFFFSYFQHIKYIDKINYWKIKNIDSCYFWLWYYECFCFLLCAFSVTQSCPTLSDPTDCSPPGSSIHRIFQARILEWVAIFFSSFLLYYFLYFPRFLQSACINRK